MYLHVDMNFAQYSFALLSSLMEYTHVIRNYHLNSYVHMPPLYSNAPRY
jgi:hypothetical protein